MIDLHVHLLPGVDDGPDELAESLGMCRLAASDGCGTLVATPHQRHPNWPNCDRPRLRELVAELRARLRSGPELLLGAEIRVDSGLLDDLEDLDASGLLPLAGSSYLLLELDRAGAGPEPRELVHELILLGWRPILAHPELLPRLTRDPDTLAALVGDGALLQVTAASVTGEFGAGARRAAIELLDRGLVHILASDAHGMRWRRPNLAAARALIADRWSEQMALDLTVNNPRAVIENRPLAA